MGFILEIEKDEKSLFTGVLLTKKEFIYYKNLEKKINEILDDFDKINLKPFLMIILKVPLGLKKLIILRYLRDLLKLIYIILILEKNY